MTLQEPHLKPYLSFVNKLTSQIHSSKIVFFFYLQEQINSNQFFVNQRKNYVSLVIIFVFNIANRSLHCMLGTKANRKYCNSISNYSYISHFKHIITK